MDHEVLNRRMKIDPSRITGQFTMLEVIDVQKGIDDQIEAIRKHYMSVNADETVKDLPIVDCYAFFTDQHNRLSCCITLHLVRVVNGDDGQPWSDYSLVVD